MGKLLISKLLKDASGEIDITKVGIVSFLAFFVLMFAFLPIILPMAPVISGVQFVSGLIDKASAFFNSGSSDSGTSGGDNNNFYMNRSFSGIDSEEIAKKEKEIQDKAVEIFDKYKRLAQINVDMPLVMSTIYYPLSTAYDESAWNEGNECTNDAGEVVSCGPDASSAEKYLSKNTKRMDDLANAMIKKTKNSYDCVVTDTLYDADSDTTIEVYGPGQLLTSEEYKGNDFPSNHYCESAADQQIVYTYSIDYEKYDKYLMDKEEYDNPYLLQSDIAKIYDIPKEVSDDPKSTSSVDYLNILVERIHDYAKIFDEFFYEKVGSKFYSLNNLCSQGVTILGGEDAGTYSLEEYVAGVISAENNWYTVENGVENIEAMKAQAVAARTYVLSRTDYCSSPIEDSSSAQNFTKNIGDRAKRAAEETAGEVLTYDNEIFSSEYDSYNCTSCSVGQVCSCKYIKEPFLDASGNPTSKDNAVTHMVDVPYEFAKDGIGGHGRGMSQIAARYRQSLGEKYETILKYFYAAGVQIQKFTFGGEGVDGMAMLKDGVYILPNVTADTSNYSNACQTVGDDVRGFPSGQIYSGMEGSKGSALNEEGFNVDNLNIYFWNNQLKPFLLAAKAAGYNINVSDGWRSFKGQCSVYGTARAGYAATPGTSIHGWGLAADLNYFSVKEATDWAHTHAAEYGLVFNVCRDYFGGDCKEDWHIQPSVILRQDYPY